MPRVKALFELVIVISDKLSQGKLTYLSTRDPASSLPRHNAAKDRVREKELMINPVCDTVQM